MLNLGILAHVDAGKTSLTERLLHAAGVIEAVGSVDRGDTQTDTLALERRRGITIKSAVVSFVVGDVAVNVIDTPGHPDFIAEVERVLRVLDGAILVVSAVGGVQAQTRVLVRALRRLRIPTLVFVNKVDRRGAGDDRIVARVAETLAPAVIPMVAVRGLGTPGARCRPYTAPTGASPRRSSSCWRTGTTICSPPTSRIRRRSAAVRCCSGWPSGRSRVARIRCSSAPRARAPAWTR